MPNGKVSVAVPSGRGMRAQSAMEYMLTYGWALIIIAIVAVLLYFVVLTPTLVSPSSCTFVSGAYCKALFFGSNQSGTKLGIFLTNTQPYPILAPSLKVNVNSANSTGECRPHYVLPGGAMICNATLPGNSIALGTLETGKIYLAAIPCQSGDANACNSLPVETYTGGFVTHSSQLLSAVPINIIVFAKNATQPANGALDPLTAVVKMYYNYPLLGATVNFTINSIYPNLSPNTTTSDSNGNALSMISSTHTGNVLVIASFAGYSANTVVSFLPAVTVTYKVSGSACAPSNYGDDVLSVDGSEYQCSYMPLTQSYRNGSAHTYSFSPQLTVSAGDRFLFSYVNGCGASGQSGTVTIYSSCNMTGTYREQYYLTVAANPSQAGTVSPQSAWEDAGSAVQLSESNGSIWRFNNWTGSGTGSYTGILTSPQITMGGPITETAMFFRALTDLSLTPASPTIDSGQSVTLVASWSYGLRPYTVSWYYGSSADCSQDTSLIQTNSGLSATSNSLAVSPTGSVYYCAKVSDSARPPDSLSATDLVTVNPALVAGPISPSAPAIDLGQSILLTSNALYGTTPYSYQWYTGAGCSSPIGGATSATYLATPSSSTNYYYKVTDSAYVPVSACSPSDRVTVNPALYSTAWTVSNTFVDISQYERLVSSLAGGTPPYTYNIIVYEPGSVIYYNLLAYSSSTTNALLYQQAAPAGTYIANVYITDSAYSPVTVSNALTYFVSLYPTALSPTATNTAVDLGQYTRLVSYATPGTGTLSYQWYTGTSCGTVVSGATSSTYFFQPSSTGTKSYSYRITDQASTPVTMCSPGYVNVVTNPALHSILWTVSNAYVDISQYERLTSTLSGGTPPYVYNIIVYEPDSTVYSNALNAGLTATTNMLFYQQAAPAGTYIANVLMTDSATTAETVANTLTYLTSPYPVVYAPTATNTAVDLGQYTNVTSDATPGTGTLSYQWYASTSCTSPITGATGSYYLTQPSSTGTKYYAYKITDQATTPVTICSPGYATVVVNPALLSKSFVASLNPIYAAQYQTLNAVISGGTPPYGYDFLIYDPYSDLVTSMFYSSVSSTSNTFMYWHAPVWGSGTFSAYVYVIDSATTEEYVSNSLSYTVLSSTTSTSTSSTSTTTTTTSSSTTSTSTTSTTTITYGMRYMSTVNELGTEAWISMTVHEESSGYNQWCEASCSFGGLTGINWYPEWNNDYSGVTGGGVPYSFEMCHTTASVEDLAVEEINVFISQPTSHTWEGYSAEGDSSSSYSGSFSYTYRPLYGPTGSPVAVAIFASCGDFACTSVSIPSGCAVIDENSDSYGFESVFVAACDQRSYDSSHTITAYSNYPGYKSIEVLQFPYGWWDFSDVYGTQWSPSSTTTTTTTTTTSTSSTSITSTSTSIATTQVQHIYCVGTYSTSDKQEVYSAPISGGGVGPWNALTSYPIQMTDAGCSIYNGYIYCVGALTNYQGGGIGTASGSPLVYSAPLYSDGTIGDWVDETDYPGDMYGAGCSAYNGYLYCVGGPTGTDPNGAFNSVYYAPISSGWVGSWTPTTSYPVSQWGNGCSIYNGYLYCIGSSHTVPFPSIAQNLVYSAPVSSGGVGSWAHQTDYPLTVAGVGCSAYNGYIYCIGRVKYGESYTYLAYYAPISGGTLGSWTSTRMLPINAGDVTGCSIYNGYIYCIGSDTSPYSQVYSAPVSSSGIGTWTRQTPYPVGMYLAYCEIPGSGGGLFGGGGPD